MVDRRQEREGRLGGSSREVYRREGTNAGQIDKQGKEGGRTAWR